MVDPKKKTIPEYATFWLGGSIMRSVGDERTLAESEDGVNINFIGHSLSKLATAEQAAYLRTLVNTGQIPLETAQDIATHDLKWPDANLEALTNDDVFASIRHHQDWTADADGVKGAAAGHAHALKNESGSRDAIEHLQRRPKLGWEGKLGKTKSYEDGLFEKARASNASARDRERVEFKNVRGGPVQVGVGDHVWVYGLGRGMTIAKVTELTRTGFLGWSGERIVRTDLTNYTAYGRHQASMMETRDDVLLVGIDPQKDQMYLETMKTRR